MMYTDPNHIKITDPGKVEGNMVFLYLDLFVKDGDFSKYLPEYKNMDELKAHYEKGGLGDVVIKKFLINVLDDTLEPMRARRKSYEDNIELVYEIINEGTKKANEKANETLARVKNAIGINYFDNTFLEEIKEKY